MHKYSSFLWNYNVLRYLLVVTFCLKLRTWLIFQTVVISKIRIDIFTTFKYRDLELYSVKKIERFWNNSEIIKNFLLIAVLFCQSFLLEVCLNQTEPWGSRVYWNVRKKDHVVYRRPLRILIRILSWILIRILCGYWIFPVSLE